MCLHDWGKHFQKVFGFKTKKPLSFLQFQHLIYDTSGVHPATPKTLSLWLEKHPDVKNITDVKHNNLKVIKTLNKQYNFSTR